MILTSYRNDFHPESDPPNPDEESPDYKPKIEVNDVSQLCAVCGCLGDKRYVNAELFRKRMMAFSAGVANVRSCAIAHERIKRFTGRWSTRCSVVATMTACHVSEKGAMKGFIVALLQLRNKLQTPTGVTRSLS